MADDFLGKTKYFLGSNSFDRYFYLKAPPRTWIHTICILSLSPRMMINAMYAAAAVGFVPMVDQEIVNRK